MYSSDFRKFDSAEVDYNLEGRYGSIKWLKESRSDDFKAIWLYVAALKEKHNINKWFFDKTFESIYPNDDKWKKNQLFKESVDIDSFTRENSLHVAIIMPLNFYTEVVTTEFINEKSKLEGYNFKIFKSPEEARIWLTEQKDPHLLTTASESSRFSYKEDNKQV